MVNKNRDNICRERHLHPSVYKRFIKTRNLIEKGVDSEELRNRGGLDLETYEALRQRGKSQKQRTKSYKENVIKHYGSLKAAPLSVGPCKKIDPVIGPKNALVLLTEFKDVKHSHSGDEFQELLFSKGSGRSLRDFYLEASWNQLDITGKVNDQWFTASDTSLNYVDESINIKYPLARKLVEETILQAKNSENIDFTPFAQNGYIDILIIVFAGRGIDTSLKIDHIRPHQGNLAEPIEVQNGIWANNYALVPELPMDDLGCYCHEVGHLLGLPDLYNWKSPVVGSWCLMAIGDHLDNGRTPSHPSAWCKIHLGWKQPQTIGELPKNQEIPAVTGENGAIYKVEIPGTGGQEYFLLENRQQKGFERNLPGSGLLIWHVDQSKCIHKAPNSDPNHFFITLIESDGKNDLLQDINDLMKKDEFKVAIKELIGDDGDAFPGITVNRNFNGESNPNSNSYSGVKSMVSITDISDSDDVMKAKIGVQPGSNLPISMNQGEISSQHPLSVIQNLLALMSPQKHVKPYDQGYGDAKQDLIEKIKDENGLNFYKTGYIEGYQKGYKKALKKLKK